MSYPLPLPNWSNVNRCEGRGEGLTCLPLCSTTRPANTEPTPLGLRFDLLGVADVLAVCVAPHIRTA